MKRILSCALCFWLLLLLVPWAAAEEATAIPISTREEMALLVAHPEGSFALTEDIDMGGMPWLPIPFSGQFNGNGHTLYNLAVLEAGSDTATTYDGNYKQYETVFAGLFSILDHATIRDLNLVNATVVVETDQHCFLGALAGYARSSTFTNCSVQTRSHLTLSSINAGVGGLVGFSVENTITDCVVDAELIFTDVNQDALCEEFLGGIYACGCGKIDRCEVNTRGFAEIYGYAHNGGIIGMHKLPSLYSKYRSSATNIDVSAAISFFEITPSRRAYCSPTIGEDIGRKCSRYKLNILSYDSFESRTAAPMLPETCEPPQYANEVTPATCTTWGYTTHTCATCGYTYRDSFTPPTHRYTRQVTTAPTCTEPGTATFTCALCGHSYAEPIAPTGHNYTETMTPPSCTEPGATTFTCAVCGHSYSEPIPPKGHTPGTLIQVKAPQVNEAGEAQILCQDCGTVLESHPIPALPYVYAERIELSAYTLNLSYKQTGRLLATVYPSEVTDPTVTFLSTDPSVAHALSDGTVVTGRCGTATITCVSADGKASGSCTVTVSYTAWQWVQHYILFGWLWDKPDPFVSSPVL